jgi:predicted ester cyclase
MTDRQSSTDDRRRGDTLTDRPLLESALDQFREGFTIDELLVGDGVTMGKWTVTCTHEGEYEGVPPTEREVELEVTNKILIEDDVIDEPRIYYNYQSMLEQLGLTDE